VPEGHTIHRLANRHEEWFAGQPVAVSSPQGRFEGAARIDGHVFQGASAWGKHLFHHYDVGVVVHVHLGLFGKFFDHTGEPPEPRDTCRMRVATAGRTIDLVGAITCELLDPGEVDAVTAGLGPDPLRDDAVFEDAWTALQRKRVGIGRALLDQSVLAGVGNVYRAEVLFTHGLHPEVPSSDVDRATFRSMWDQLQQWLRLGVRMGRIVTTDPDEIGTPRSRMKRSESRYVYKQDVCRRCGSDIRRWDLAGRWAYACESCQVPPQASTSS
jgi:endonuclease-8